MFTVHHFVVGQQLTLLGKLGLAHVTTEAMSPLLVCTQIEGILDLCLAYVTE